ncbi:MAG: hypothetical protein DMF73_19310 [Acidobacteria bacterium]|nr:MAG: hypothetical protein DMF73_19310 [Acidobacteriota bacterium]
MSSEADPTRRGRVTDDARGDNAGSTAACVCAEDVLGDTDLFADWVGVRLGSAIDVDLPVVVRGGSVEFDAGARLSPFTANELS